VDANTKRRSVCKVTTSAGDGSSEVAFKDMAAGEGRGDAGVMRCLKPYDAGAEAYSPASSAREATPITTSDMQMEGHCSGTASLLGWSAAHAARHDPPEILSVFLARLRAA
jgi:hypothetical protein